MVGAITEASAEQRTGIGHVHAAIADMDAVTQQNAALVAGFRLDERAGGSPPRIPSYS
jgi:methyl-accepting chemotaxis protein